jgi:hypothetical protein
MMQRQMNTGRILSQVFQILDNSSGKYEADYFYRITKAQDSGLSFEDFDIVIREQINRSAIVSAPDGKLWLRSRVPQRPTGSPVPPQPSQPT